MGYYALLIAQFYSTVGDRALYFTVIHIYYTVKDSIMFH